jgi:alpha-1,2-glucosyltransferase
MVALFSVTDHSTSSPLAQPLWFSILIDQGDKANHVATVHLAQLLYLWPFIAFFSLPLLLTSALSKVFSLISPITAFLSSRQSTHPASTSFSSPIQRKLRLIFNLTFLFTSLIIILLIIKYNTLIHPFTLADNRHYVFYVFRYTILRHPLIRYLLAPAYMLSFYLTYLALSNPSSPTPLQTKRLNTRPQEQADGPRTSFLLVFVLSTALSLITAPLVEPRYFIIPWVVWRLHVPTSPPRISSRPSRKKTTRTKSEEGILARFSEVVRFWATEGGGGRLWGETFWFLLINAVTGYVFLYRGFEWPQEPGNVQRFMW